MSVNALAAAGDVVIAAILCTLLQQSRTGFRASDTMITKLIMFSIGTGLLTSICAIMSLISVCDKSQATHVELMIQTWHRLQCGLILSSMSHSFSAWAVVSPL